MQAKIDPNFDVNAYEQRQFAEAVAPVADEMSYTPQVQQKVSSQNFMPYSVYENYTDNSGVLDRAAEAMQKQGIDLNSFAQNAQNSGVNEQQEKLSNTMRTIYAMNFGEDGARKLDQSEEQYINNLREQYGDVFTDDDVKIFRRNAYANAFQKARDIWNGSPVEVTDQSLLKLITNKNIDAESLGLLGVFADVKRVNPMNSFHRGAELSSLDHQIKENFFDTKERTLEEAQNSLTIANSLYSYDTDSIIGFTAGQMWDMTVGAAQRQYGGAIGATVVEGLSLLAAPVTGGMSLKLTNGYMFAKDMFDMTKQDIGFNAMVLDPTLTKNNVQHSMAVNGVAFGVAALNTIGFGKAIEAGEKLVHVGRGVDEVLKTFGKEGTEQAQKDFVIDGLINSAKVMGVSEGVNVGIASVTGVTRQLTTNIVGHNKNVWENVDTAFIENAKMGAGFGLMPLPAAVLRTGRDAWLMRKAQESASHKLENNATTNAVQSTLQKGGDPDGTMNTIHEAEGFHELRTFVNIDEAQEWLKKNNREASDEIKQKIEQAEADGLTEISFDPNEQIKMGDDYKSFFDELGKKEIDDMSPLEVAETFSKEEQAKAEDAIHAAEEMQTEVERQMTEDSKLITADMYRDMDGTDMPTKTRDAIVAMNNDFYRSMSKTFGIPMRELWQSVKVHWKNFDKTLYADPNVERVEKKLRGNYSPEDGTIYLSHGADAATAVHEYGHFALDAMMKLAKSREEQGKPITNLSSMLDDAFGKDWRTKTDADLAEMHERFAYQFIDYILSGKRDGKNSTISPVMNAVKKLIISAERDRARKINKDVEFKGAEDAREFNKNEYMGTQNKLWVDRNSGFDGIANALFKAEETMRRAEEDYSSERIDNFIQDAELQKQLKGNHEAMVDIEEATREADAAREETQNMLEAEMIKQSGYAFSFVDKFMKSWRKMTHDAEAIKTFTENSKVARELFRKYRDEIREKFDKSTLGALYTQMSETKFKRDGSLNDMVKHGLLSENDIQKLKQLGIVDDNATAVVSDFFGKVDGTDSNRIMREKQIADTLHAILQFPTKQRLVYEMTMQRVVEGVKEKAKLTAEHDGIRRSFLRMKERIAQSTARILAHLTHTPADRQGVINFAAKKLISTMRLADLDEAVFMRTAKNARRRTEMQVGKSEYEAAARTNRAERVAITCTNLITKVRYGLQKQYNKNIKYLRNDKYAAEHGLSNKYMDLARLVAHKQGIYVDRKSVTKEQIREYAKEYPELGELLDFCEEHGLLEQNASFLNHTVGEVNFVYDVINEIRTKARSAKVSEIEGVSASQADNAKAVGDALKYQKWASDGVDANGVAHKKGDLVYDKDGNPVEIPRTTKELTNRAGNATPEAGGIHGFIAKYKDKLKAGLGRISSWCTYMDGKEDGIIYRTLYKPVAYASAAGEQATKKCQQEINDVISKIPWKSGVVVSPLIDRVTGKPMEFGNGKGIYGNAGYHLFGFMMHMGNEENWSKLLEAHGWKEKDVFTFINQMIDEGYVTKETLEALNKVWAMFDDQFKKANETFYKINGRYLRKVEARPIKIKVGDEVVTLTGGYAPLIMDSRRNGIKTKPLDFNSMKPEDYEKQLFENDGVNRSPNFMKERTNAVYYLDFNPNRMLSVMPKVANYAEIMPMIREVYNFWSRGDVQSSLKQYAPHSFNDFIKPFILKALKRSAIHSGDVFGNELLNNIANHTGMNLMFGNIANTVTQSSGIVNALQKVGAYYLIKSFGARGAEFTKLRDEVCGLSDLMQSRIVESNSHLVESITHITSGAEGNTLFNKLRAKASHLNNFTSKYAYFMQKFLQDRIDVAVFKGAYDQEVAKMMPEFEAKYKGKVSDDEYQKLFDAEVKQHAVNVADMAVIKTQSSSNMLDKSAYETSNALNKLVFQFGNYFLTVMNLQAEEISRLQRTNAKIGEKAKTIAINFALGVVLPSYIAEAVMKTARGDWWNNDNDPDDLLIDLFAVQPVKIMTSSVPYANGILNGFIDSVMGNNYRGGFLNAPAVSTINQLTSSMSRLFQGKFDGRTIKSAAIGFGLATGFAPSAAIGKAIGNAYDVASGDIRARDTAELIRMFATGSVRSDLRNN